MSTVTVRARVAHLPESQIEAKLLGDYVEPTPYVAWRNKTIRSEQIANIEQYDPQKCLIYTYEDKDPILVREPHSQVRKKWEAAKLTEIDTFTYGSEIEEEDEKNEDD